MNDVEFFPGPNPAPTPPPTPAPKPAPVVGSVDPAKIQKTLTQLINVGKGVSRVTETEWDDKAFAFLEPLVTTRDFAELLAFLIDQFDGDPAQAAKVVMSAIRDKLSF